MFCSTFAAALRMLALLIALGGLGTAAMAQGSTTSANVQLAREVVFRDDLQRIAPDLVHLFVHGCEVRHARK